MDENLRTFFRSAWHDPRRFFLWLTLLSVLGLAAGYVLDVSSFSPSRPPTWLPTWACAAAVALAAGLLTGILGFILSWIPPVRRVLSWLLQRRFLALAAVLIPVGLFYAEEDWRGKGAWDSFKRAQEAKGVHFELVRLAPPPVPDDQNFAMVPIVASTYNTIVDRNGRRIPATGTNAVEPLTMPIEYSALAVKAPLSAEWRRGRPTDLAAWQAYYREVAAVTSWFPVPAEPQTPAKDVLLALSRYDSAIEELRHAARLPYSRFPLEYDAEMPFAILLPHLARIRGPARALELRAVAELNLGQSDKALDDIKLILRLADSIRNEPILISHLVRIALVNLALQPVWEGTARHRWTAAQLAALDQELGKWNLFADYHRSIRSEQACAAAAIDWLRRTRRFEEVGVVSADEFLPQLILMRLMPGGWFYQNQLRCVRLENQGFLPIADESRRVFSPETLREANKELMRELNHRNPCNFLESMLLSALGNVAVKFASGQADVDLARVACALERHRLARGEYPESLDALAPQFPGQVPHDVISGQPLHYRRIDANRFVLYSVGWNETDDDGEVGLEENGRLDRRKGDWIWISAPN